MNSDSAQHAPVRCTRWMLHVTFLAYYQVSNHNWESQVKKKSQKLQVFAGQLGLYFGMSASRITTPGFDSGFAPDSSFWLMLSLGSSSGDSGNWIPATHTGDQSPYTGFHYHQAVHLWYLALPWLDEQYSRYLIFDCSGDWAGIASPEPHMFYMGGNQQCGCWSQTRWVSHGSDTCVSVTWMLYSPS